MRERSEPGVVAQTWLESVWVFFVIYHPVSNYTCNKQSSFLLKQISHAAAFEQLRVVLVV